MRERCLALTLDLVDRGLLLKARADEAEVSGLRLGAQLVQLRELSARLLEEREEGTRKEGTDH